MKLNQAANKQWDYQHINHLLIIQNGRRNSRIYTLNILRSCLAQYLIIYLFIYALFNEGIFISILDF
jgi:hypothetical protein